MKLALNFPAPWDLKETKDGRHAAILPGAPGGLPDAIVTWGPLIVKPDEPRVWVDQTARADLPRGTKVKIGRSVDQTTRDGWPLRLVEAEVLTDTNELVELRLCAFFTFMEHAAAVIVRANDRARFEAAGRGILAILGEARPDWRAQPLCLADTWDFEAPRANVRSVTKVQPSGADYFEQELARLATLDELGAIDFVQRALSLLALSRAEDALEAARSAIAADPALESAHYVMGVALGTLGRHREAIAAWTAALAVSPRVDTHYNIGQAHQLLGEHEPALQAFRAARELDPSDVMLLRKIAQCLYALDRYDEGAAARADLRRAWSTSQDPRIRMLVEYVFDQFDAGAFRVHGVETLRPRDPSMYTVLAFRAVDAADRPLGIAVHVETSDQAKAAGTPFVIGVISRGQFKGIGTLAAMPPYPELKKQVLALLGAATAKA